MTSPTNQPPDSLREAITSIIVTGMADAIDSYEDIGTFPPRLSNAATDAVLELIKSDRRRLLDRLEKAGPEDMEEVGDDNEITPTLPDFYNAANQAWRTALTKLRNEET